MAQWSRKKVNSENLNKNNEYTRDSQFAIESLNAVVNSGLYSQDFVEHLAEAPDVSEAGNVGTPTVTFVENPNATTDKPYKRFKFSNLKGEKGDTGAPAGFGTPTATATTLSAGSKATVSVTSSGDDTSKEFNFSFGIPKGADATGAVTINGVEASVDFTSDPQTQINSKASQIALDVTNVTVESNTQDITRLRDNKANQDLSNVLYPQLTPDGLVHTASGYTTYMSTDGNTWYVKFPTLLKICHISVTLPDTSSLQTVTLPIAFYSRSYMVYIQREYNSSDVRFDDLGVQNKTGTGFSIRGYNSPAEITCIGY